MDEKEKALREEIFSKVREFYNFKFQEKPFVRGDTSIPYAGRMFDDKELVSLVDSALDFWLTAGRFANEFEINLSEYIGVKHCLLTNSGSSANLLAISALTSPKLEERALNPGDEVVTVACAFPTTVNPIFQNNLVPVFLDVDVGTYNIQVDSIEAALTDKTKAIILAHTLGNPFNLEKVMEITRKHGLWLIEDNCDALGSKFGGRYTGSFGDVSTFSFYPPHHITMGEGGALATDNTKIKRCIESFRDWGRDCWCGPGQDDSCGKRFGWKLGKLPYGYDHKYIYSHIGYNLKLTDMQAAIGVSQLEKLPAFVEARQRNFKLLSASLRKFDEHFVLPEATPGAEPSWFGFPLTVRDSARFKRADIVKFLDEKKIATRMLFCGNITKHPAYADCTYRIPSPLINTDRIMHNTFWIGVYPGITQDRLEYIVDMFQEFIAGL